MSNWLALYKAYKQSQENVKTCLKKQEFLKPDNHNKRENKDSINSAKLGQRIKKSPSSKTKSTNKEFESDIAVSGSLSEIKVSAGTSEATFKSSKISGSQFKYKYFREA